MLKSYLKKRVIFAVLEGFRKMNKELKDVQQAEQELFEELLSVILFLNNNGMRLDIVRSLIYIKVDEAFSAYEELDLRKRFKEDFEK